MSETFTFANKRSVSQPVEDWKKREQADGSTLLLKKSLLKQSEAKSQTSEYLRDGDYYVFAKKEEDSLKIGYIYTTWCGSPFGMHIGFSPVEMKKPLPLMRTGDSQCDCGHLKTFLFNQSSSQLAEDIYNRALLWLKKMRQEQINPKLDITQDCTVAILQISQGVVTSLREKGGNAIPQTSDVSTKSSKADSKSDSIDSLPQTDATSEGKVQTVLKSKEVSDEDPSTRYANYLRKFPVSQLSQIKYLLKNNS